MVYRGGLGVIRSLPLLTLYLTERCNSRCVSCDYWRHGRTDVSLDSVARLVPELERLGTKLILISGGEPLIHPEWAEIARLLRGNDFELWLLTSGLSLAKHAARAATLFQSITVSLDGTDAGMYAAIRGVERFDKVCAGIRAAADTGVPISVRVTVQRRNYRYLPAFVALARQCRARRVSFLAADVGNPHAFGRSGASSRDIALGSEDLPEFSQVLDALERDHAEDFSSGFIAESPVKLRRLLQYYAALCGAAPFPPTRCNAPEFSAVLEAGGRLNPCFFIQGPAPAAATADGSFEQALNGPTMLRLRADIAAGRRAECITCVCSMWREPDRLATHGAFLSH